MESIQPFDRLFEVGDAIEEIVLREREIHQLAQVCLDCFKDWALSHQTPCHFVQETCDHSKVIRALSFFAQAAIVHINSYASWPSFGSQEAESLIEDDSVEMCDFRLKSWMPRLPNLLNGYVIEMDPFGEGYTERVELTRRLVDCCCKWAKLTGYSERRIQEAFGNSTFEDGCRSLANQLAGKLTYRIECWERDNPWKFMDF